MFKITSRSYLVHTSRSIQVHLRKLSVEKYVGVGGATTTYRGTRAAMENSGVTVESSRAGSQSRSLDADYYLDGYWTVFPNLDVSNITFCKKSYSNLR